MTPDKLREISQVFEQLAEGMENGVVCYKEGHASVGANSEPLALAITDNKPYLDTIVEPLIEFDVKLKFKLNM